MDDPRRMPSADNGARGVRLTPGDLCALLAREGVWNPEQSQEALLRYERQHKILLREQKHGVKLTAMEERALSQAITPIEVLASFAFKDPTGKPVEEDRLTELFARALGMPYEKIDPLKLDSEFVTSVISKPFAQRHQLIPLRATDTTITVAMVDPTHGEALESIRRLTGKQVDVVLASKSDIQKIIVEFYGFRHSVKSAALHLDPVVDLGNLEQFVRMLPDRELEASDQHVVRAVEYLFNYAFDARASDIHIEPKREESLVRLRIDGALHPVQKMPKVVHNAVVSRIKAISRLDIAEKRRPQDGRIKTNYKDKEVEIRVSTLPVAFGEKAVLRIFDPEIIHDDLGQLGFRERELGLMERFIAQPHGIILVTGPTGSGKTTTLYTALRRLSKDDVNITTIEDPIEMVFDRINQTAVNPACDVTFATALRTILRQDPDIIMVGEIRDLETAQHAIQAALTGHLVLSTLHTNDAPSAITRLLDLGAQHFLVASTVLGIVAQRLMKVICPNCAAERGLTEEERRALGVPLRAKGPITVKFGEGCMDCRMTGYRGRTGIYEVFEVSDAVRELIREQADSVQIKAQARKEGMVTLREAAVAKMLEGTSSFEEVLRVTSEK
jgi:general secretion pathway protein E